MCRMNSKPGYSSDTSQTGWTTWLSIACISVTASASFSYGYGIGAPNMYSMFTEPFLEQRFGICDVDDEAVRLKNNCTLTDTGSQLVTDGEKPTRQIMLLNQIMNGLPQTIYVVGCFIGSLTGGSWLKLKMVSRRSVFHVNFPLIYMSVACMMLSYYKRIISLFYISRLLHGYQSGMACCIVPTYVNDVASRKVRGSAGVLHQFFVTVGIFVAQIIGLPVMLSSFNTWHFGMCCLVIPVLLANLIIPFLPNSPVEMVSRFKNNQAAVESLRKLRGTNDVECELDMIIEESTSSSSGRSDPSRGVSLKELFTSTSHRWPVITSLTLLTVQALSGVNAVFFYSGKIFQTAGIQQAHLYYATSVTGLINILVTIAVIPLIEKLGRKPLLIYPMSAMLIIFVLLTTFIQLNETRHSVALGYVTVILTLLFICAFAVGLGPIAFLYPNEVVRQNARDCVLQVGLCLNYVGNLFLSLCFPAINMVLRGYVFLLFFVIVALGLAVLWKKMPETKNKSIEEIERFWGIVPLHTPGKVGDSLLPKQKRKL